VEPGSVFFEKMFAGLDGPADKSPADGVVTYHELFDYLYSEIETATDGSQCRRVLFPESKPPGQGGNYKAWNPGKIVAFGQQASEIFERGSNAQAARHYTEAFLAYQEGIAAGNADSHSAWGACMNTDTG
jgi:hypothetical protein